MSVNVDTVEIYDRDGQESVLRNRIVEILSLAVALDKEFIRRARGDKKTTMVSQKSDQDLSSGRHNFKAPKTQNLSLLSMATTSKKMIKVPKATPLQKQY